MELVSAIIGAISALIGVAFGYWLQLRVEKRKRIIDSVFRALAPVRQHQYDVLELGTAFVKIGDQNHCQRTTQLQSDSLPWSTG